MQSDTARNSSSHKLFVFRRCFVVDLDVDADPLMRTIDPECLFISGCGSL